MALIISTHSYRGGTGKSNITANLAALLAVKGRRVGIVDTDIQSPGVHVLFGLDESSIIHSLNDFLWGRCEIREAAHDVTAQLPKNGSGPLFLIPSSLKAGEIARVLREGYDVSLLNDGFQKLVDSLNLDALFIDTHPGLNEETLLSIAISDTLIVILRPDQQDYQGTGVTLEVARKLEVPRTLLLVNKIPSALNAADVKSKVEGIYKCSVAGVLHHCDEMMALASGGLFAVRYPNHPLTATLSQITELLRAPRR